MSDVKVRAFTTTISSGASGNVDLTDNSVFGGDTPKFVMVVATRANGAGSPSYVNRGAWSFGHGDGASGSVLGMAMASEDNVTRTQSIRASCNFLVGQWSYHIWDNNSVATHRGLVTTITDGVRIAIQSATGGFGIRVSILAIGGDGVRVETGALAGIIGSTGSQSLSLNSVDIKPDFMFFTSMGDNSFAYTSPTDDAIMSIGCAGRHHDGTIKNGCIAIRDEDNVLDSNAVSRAQNNRCVMIPDPTNRAKDFEMEVTDMGVGSVTVDVATNATPVGDPHIYYTALEFVNPQNVHISFDTLTSSATSFTSGAHKFTPIGGFTLMADPGVSTDGYNTWTEGSEGASFGVCMFDAPAGTLTNVETTALRYEDASGSYTECETWRTAGWGFFPGYQSSATSEDFYGTPAITVDDEFEVATLSGTAPDRDYPVITVMFASEDSNIRKGTVEIVDILHGDIAGSGKRLRWES